MKIPAAVQNANITISTHTTVAPTGVEARMDMRIPDAAHHTEITAEARITPKKLLNKRMADRAGKMINAEIRRRCV